MRNHLPKAALLHILTTLLLALLLGVPVSHAALESDADAGQARHIRVGIYENYPFVYEKNGLPTGLHLEILKKIAKEEGWVLDYHYSASLKYALQGLEIGTIDLGLGIVPTPTEKLFLDFSTEKTASLKGQIFIKTGRSDIRSMKDLDGKTVAFITRSGLGRTFREIAEKLHVTPVSRQIGAYEDLAKALVTGAVDAAIFSSQQGRIYAKIYGISPTPIHFKPVDPAFAVAKGKNKSIITAIDQYLFKWKTTDGKSFLEMKNSFLNDLPQNQETWTRNEKLTVLCICLLFITFGILLGNFMANVADHHTVSKAYIVHIIVFTLAISIGFGLIDSLIEWYLFNDERQLSFLELALTNIPQDKLYMRGMFFLICCFFGLFIAKYISRYEAFLSMLMVSVNRLEELTDNARDMIYRMSIPSGQYDYVSKAATDIFGYAPEDFYRRPHLIKELVHPDWESYFTEQWNNLLAGKMPPPDYEFQIITKAGETRWINQRNTLYRDDSGTPYALEGIVTDITHRKVQTPA